MFKVIGDCAVCDKDVIIKGNLLTSCYWDEKSGSVTVSGLFGVYPVSYGKFVCSPECKAFHEEMKTAANEAYEAVMAKMLAERKL